MAVLAQSAVDRPPPHRGRPRLAGLLELSSVTALERAVGADFSSEDDRFEYRQVPAGLLERFFARLWSPEVGTAWARTALVWSPYRTYTDAVAHLPAREGRNAIVSVMDQPGVGPYLTPGSRLVTDRAARPAAPAPALGLHTPQVLVEQLGLSARQIATLQQSGAVAADA